MSSEDSSRKAWHRIFGVVLTDLMMGTPFDVELEKDLSIKQQYLDVIVIRKRPGALSFRLPDGFEDLADHNLITYKSMNEALDDWALKELTGHYVNFRKQVEGDTLRAEEAFRLFGVSTRYPQKLAEEVQLIKKQDGVYETLRGTDLIRIIVLREIAREEHNAFWHMFSAVDKQVQYGTGQFRFKGKNTTTALLDLFKQYKLEGLNMPFTVEQYFDESLDTLWSRLTEEQKKRLTNNMTTEERLEGISLEEIMGNYTADEIKSFLARRETKQQSNGESNDD